MLGGQYVLAVHPHIQRGILRIGETAFEQVQLHRRNAEVEEDSVQMRDTEPQ